MNQTFTTKAEESLNKVIDAFQKGEVAERCALATFPMPNIPACEWTLHNRWLALIQGGEVDCRGFRQWQEAGRNVKKGARAVYIFRPWTKKVKDEGEDREKVVCVGFSPIPVFAASATEGEPLDYEEIKPPDIPLMKVAEAWGLRVSAQPFTERYYGYFSGREKAIVLCSPDVSVFLHELCHAAHARLNGGLKGGQDPIQEIVAELGAEVLRRILGSEKDTSGHSYSYIESYASKMKVSTLNACLKVLRETAEVVGLILESAASLTGERTTLNISQEEELCVRSC